MLVSPTLPLPVEFVAGGDGRPDAESVDDAPGLGGSGRSGRLGGVEPGLGPMYMADKGRDVLVDLLKLGRGVIGIAGEGKTEASRNERRLI